MAQKENATNNEHDEAVDQELSTGPSLLGSHSDSQKGHLQLQKQEGRKGWYVIHTYSGYEDQVADSLRQRAE